MTSPTVTLSKDRLAELLAKARAAKTARDSVELPKQETLQTQPLPQIQGATDKYGNLITYNAKQQEFINLVLSGKSCVLLGSAGTGKTTCMQGVIAALIQSGRIHYLKEITHKYLPIQAHGIIVTAFTRRAVANIRRNMSADIKPNCITIHKALEYQPEIFTVVDENGEEKKSMCFVPNRHRFNPLPAGINTVIVEESSMLSTDLYAQLEAAFSAGAENTQVIFLGDIQQLPPVFGPAILGHKMLSLPVVELTEVYRQALDSPIIRLAHRILSGTPIPPSEYNDWKVPEKLTIHPWKKKLHADIATLTAAKFFTTSLDSGLYNPAEDMILIPFNKAFGSIELNKHIAQHLATKEGKLVHEIIAGFNKLYFSVGDKVLYDKEDAEILSITPNATYHGKRPAHASKTLDYWGYDSGGIQNAESQGEYSEEEIDFLLEQAAATDEERVKVSSHVIKLRMLDSEVEREISSVSDLNTLIHAYVLTVHKSQGSEWKKVFLVFHQSHATMIQRELLYTAVTRAREELYVICEPETFTKGILSQRIKGNTLEEKAEYFKGKLTETLQ